MNLSRILISITIISLLSACNPSGSGSGAVSAGPLPAIGLNSPPVAFADIASGPPDTGLVIEALANDMDPDGDSLSLLSVDTPVDGTVSIDDNGTPDFKSDDAVFYVPNPGFIGTAVFSYTISDGNNGTASGKITVAIGTNLVKDGFPVAVNDSISTTTDNPVRVPVLGNDLDSDGDAVVITGVSFPANGTVSIDDNGTPGDRSDDLVNYSPALGFSGIDSFVYTITDGTTTVSAAVTVDVTPLVPPSGPSSQTLVRGRLVKGPLVGAIIELYVLDDFGFALTSLPVAQAVSDMNGYWQASVPSPRTDLLVVSRGGAYIDEARIQDVAGNRYTFFDTVDRLETALPSTENFAVTSVFTSALLLRARYGAANGGFSTHFQSARADATGTLGFNPLVNDPANPANPSFTASPASRWHALALGGVSNVINRVSLFYLRSAPDYEMVNAVIRDLEDCQLDGRDFSGVITFTLDGVPVAMPTGINLNTEIIRFRNNNSERYSTTALQTVDNALCASPPTPVDMTPPSISLLGSNPLSLVLGTSFTDPGAIAIDNRDGDISAAILISGTVDTTTPGSYLITYSVSDSAGNTATTDRNVTVIDNSIPVIALSGLLSVTIEAGTLYTDVGATASDAEDGDITALIVSAGTVNTLVPGAYQINYDVTDSDGNAAVTVSRNVTVIDTTPPTLTIVGNAVINITQNDAYSDAGAIAIDSVDGDISMGLVISNPVDTSVPGTYSVTYQSTDSAGNAAVTTRTVNVIPNGIPSISLVGSPTVNVEAGSAYFDQGASANDPEDGDLTASIATTNLVNTSVVGTYVVSYNVVDSAGNAAAQVSRTVVVADSVSPVITLSGLATVSVLTGTTYVDSGATAFDAFDGDVSGNIINTNPVDTSVNGVYSVLYDVSDAAGNAAIQVTRAVTVSSGDVPEINLLGSSSVTHEAATSYSDAGATGSDTEDGDLSASISVTGTVDVNVPDSYLLSYDVTDSHGNAAVQVTRTVNVTDTSSPVITLAGSPVVTSEAAVAYSEPGVTANDSLDGNISGSVVVTGTVNTFSIGDYVLTYNVNDAAGNAATSISRTVQVRDTTLPVIALTGATTITHEAATSFSDPGFSANDTLDGNISGTVVVTGSVNTLAIGDYVLTYNVNDAAGNAAATLTRTVQVRDTTVPVITLAGVDPQTIEAGSAYTELNATASDNFDGDISGNIVIDASAVNTAALGSYAVNYNVSDSEGNVATTVNRTVTVVDTTVPVITLTGASPQTMEAGSAYPELNATASDNLDGDISGNIVIDSSAVNTAALGSYVVTYNVSDSEGHVAVTVNRTVNVVDTTAPVIAVLGNTPETVAEDTAYIDAGAAANDNLDGDLTSSIATVSTVNTAVPGPYTVTYDVVDAASNNATQAVRNVTVTPVNDAPVLIFPMPDDTATETAAYSNDLSLYFSDEENDSLNYAVTGLPIGTGLALNATTGILSGAANAVDVAASPISLTVTAEDPSLDSAQDTFLLTINQVVDLALLKTVDDATPNEGQAIVYTIALSNAGPSAASNIDIQDLQPAGVTFGTATPSAGSFIGNTWSIPVLASGAGATLVINATVDAGTSGSSIVNVAELIAVDQTEADIVESDSATINVPTGASVSKTWVGGSNGPVGSETDWNRNGNWSPTGVPSTYDEITIPGTAFDPVLAADVTVSSLRVSAGSNLDIGPHTLTVTGDIRGDSPITGTGLVVVTAGTVRGGLPSLRIDGNVKVQNNLTVNGDLTVLGTFDATTSVVVNGNLNVTGGTGILLMQRGASLLIVNGDVLFNGGDHSVFVDGGPPMDKGDMWVTGDFTQSGNPFSFVGEASHRVILDGVGDQTITMMNPDNSNPNPATPPASGSRFANLYLAKDQSTDGNVVLATDIAVLIQLQSSGAYNPRVISSTGSKLIAGGVNFALGTFDNVPVEFVDGDDLNFFRLITFENMANDIAQLRLRRSETFASSYNFDNLSFMSLPNTVMGGYYIEGENLGGAPITLGIWNSFPGSGEADSNTIGNFTLNW